MWERYNIKKTPTEFIIYDLNTKQVRIMIYSLYYLQQESAGRKVQQKRR